MFDITKIPAIINHLKSISKYYKESSKEIIIFCTYCDDSTRHKADHGHLYISKTQPVSTVSDVVLQERLFVC